MGENENGNRRFIAPEFTCKTNMLIAIQYLLKYNVHLLSYFEKDFESMHTHILLQEHYYGRHEKDDNSRFMIINNLGVFDNLVNFGRRLYNEITQHLPKGEPQNKISINYSLAGMLCIEIENVDSLYLATFIDCNQEVSNKHVEGIKFLINK